MGFAKLSQKPRLSPTSKSRAHTLSRFPAPALSCRYAPSPGVIFAALPRARVRHLRIRDGDVAGGVQLIAHVNAVQRNAPPATWRARRRRRRRRIGCVRLIRWCCCCCRCMLCGVLLSLALVRGADVSAQHFSHQRLEFLGAVVQRLHAAARAALPARRRPRRRQRRRRVSAARHRRNRQWLRSARHLSLRGAHAYMQVRA